MNELSSSQPYNSHNESQYVLKSPWQALSPSSEHLRTAKLEERLIKSGESSRGRIRVVIADDHGIFRSGVAMLLQAQPDMELVGEASTGREAVKAVELLQPDLVLMDISMPDMDGLEATRAITARHSKVAVLILSMYDDEDHFLRSLEAGAAGFVPKCAASSELMTAIRSIHHGDVFLHPSMAKSLLTKYLGRAPAAQKPTPSNKLTGREEEVLRLVAEGLLNREIAKKLGVSESTVERHRSNIMEKLNLHSRIELIKYAVRKGIVQVDRQA